MALTELHLKICGVIVWLSRNYIKKYVVLMALYAKKVADPCCRNLKCILRFTAYS